MPDKPPFTSHELDAATRQRMYAHRGHPADGYCIECEEEWPCRYAIQASITLKLSALIRVLQNEIEIDAHVVLPGGGADANTQKGQRR